VAERDGYWKAKQRTHAMEDQARPTREYAPIEMPRNSAIGFVNAFFAVVTGFALIWHIWWMAGAGVTGVFLTMLAFAFRNEEEIKIPTEQISRFERTNPAEIAV
jgi:cytochrome o ubiquinol oxidase subunit 1